MKDTAMGSLAEKLCSYISTAIVHDSNYDIAVMMVQHYREIKGMSISQVADLCYVSQSAVSRFCRFLGFENFKEFKRCLDNEFNIKNDYSKQFYALLSQDEDRALSAYRDELIKNIHATISQENIDTAADVVREIHDASKVAYFSHHFLWDVGRFLQGKLMMMDKYIEQYLDYDAQLQCAQTLTGDSFVIVCSVGGSYISRYSEIWNLIVNSGCKILVITQNFSSAQLNTVDYLMRCGTTNRNDVGKYSALMLADYLVMRYMKQYDADKTS